MSYQKPPIIDEDETADVPFGTTITPPTTTGHRLSTRMIDIVAAGMLFVTGVVLMQDGGSSYNHFSGSYETENGSITSTAEGLVVAPPKKCGSCYGAGTKGECCNTCDDVRAAYQRKHWSLLNTEEIVPADIAQCNAAQDKAIKAADDCVKSSGSYDSAKDYCFSCGGADDDDGTLGYCWNSQGCAPACANLHEVFGSRADCGTACTEFSS